VIEQNLATINKKIHDALDRANRTDSAKLLAVTKHVGPERINELIALGIECIGENRVQEAAEKLPQLSRAVEKHMIGHLQSNKVRQAVTLFDVIHAVDSLKLAKEIDKRSLEAGKVMPILFEINIGGEESKYGIKPEDAEDFYKQLLALTNIKVIGIMTIAPLVPPEETRPYFQKMKELNDSLGLQYLSMGMTDDYEVAIEEGSNLVRIGRGLFG